MSKAKPKLLLRLRTWEGADFVTAWIIRREGGAESGLMAGELLPRVAEMLANELGLPVEREHNPLAGATEISRPGCATVAQQKTLWEESEAP